MARFQGVDYYEIDALLTEEQRMIRDTVRGWVDDELMPVINDAYIGRYLPKQLIPGMAELGVFGANLPEEYGCAGLDNVSYGLIMQELERGDSGIRSFASVQGALCMYPIYAFGSEEQKHEYLPRMAAGEVIGCFGLTEPDFGSNPGGMITRAQKTDDGWVINGAKMWITNGSTANIAIIWAKTGDLDDSKSIRGFIVPTDTPGFSAKDQKGKLSLLASDTSELVLQDVRVPDSALLPKSGGLKSPLMCLTQARYGIAWGAIGAAMACYDEAVSYAKQRVMFGRPHRRHADPADAPGRDADGDHQGAAAGVAAGHPQGPGNDAAGAGVAGQAQQRGHGLRVRPRGASPSGRQRHPGGVPVHAPHGQPGIRLHLRGHARRARPHPGPGHHRVRRVLTADRSHAETTEGADELWSAPSFRVVRRKR